MVHAAFFPSSVAGTRQEPPTGTYEKTQSLLEILNPYAHGMLCFSINKRLGPDDIGKDQP